ncbi:MAG: twin-arginine translocation signal domain-containing protein, partial [Planctomycetota bacterium]
MGPDPMDDNLKNMLLPQFHDQSRRSFLTRSGMGLGALALMQLLGEEGLLAQTVVKPLTKPAFYDLKPKQPMLEPKAKAVISMFMHGG